MSHVVTWHKQAFTGTVLAHGRVKKLVEYRTANPDGTRVQWFWRWKVRPLVGDTTPRTVCLHRREPCCERFGG